MIDLFKVLPSLLQHDDFSKTLSKILNKYLNEISDVYDSLFIMKNLHNFKDEVLDEIAKDKSILWYDSMLPTERKIDIIKNHRLVYRTLGSERAVLQLIKDYFGTLGSIENWYEYGGTHHRFKIILNDLDFITSFLDFFYRFLDSLKWVKSTDTWLDDIILNRNIYKFLYTGCVAGNIKYTNIIVKSSSDKVITTLYWGIIINKVIESNLYVKVLIPFLKQSSFKEILVNKIRIINQCIKGVSDNIEASFFYGIVLNNIKMRRCYIG